MHVGVQLKYPIWTFRYWIPCDLHVNYVLSKASFALFPLVFKTYEKDCDAFGQKKFSKDILNSKFVRDMIN